MAMHLLLMGEMGQELMGPVTRTNTMTQIEIMVAVELITVITYMTMKMNTRGVVHKC